MKTLKRNRSNDARGRGRTRVGIGCLPGVGPATAEKTTQAGFDDLLSLAVMSPADLAEQAEIGEAVASKMSRHQKRWQISADSFRWTTIRT